jgi:hypothetical protein
MEPGPGIRVIDTDFCGERWIVEAEASYQRLEVLTRLGFP